VYCAPTSPADPFNRVSDIHSERFTPSLFESFMWKLFVDLILSTNRTVSVNASIVIVIVTAQRICHRMRRSPIATTAASRCHQSH
jgi:hypothetical protein